MGNEWPIVRLADHCLKIGSGATPKGGSGVYLDKGEIYLIRSQNVYNDGFSPDGLVFITDDAADKLKNVVVEKNDILLNITGDSVARVCLAVAEYLPARVNQHVAIIRPNPKEFDSRFVRYFLASPYQQALLLNLASAGATRNALTKAMIENFEVPKPPFAIQISIADQLEGLDKKITLNRQLNQTLEHMAQALFKSWFVDFDPVIDNALAAGNEIPSDLQDRALLRQGIRQLQLAKADHKPLPENIRKLFPSEFELTESLGWVPKGWGVTHFSEIVEKYIDNRGKTPPIEQEGIPLLEVKHLPDNAITPILATEKRVSQETYDSWFRAHLEPDDIIISTVGTIGRICLVPKNVKLTIAQNLLGFRFNKNLARSSFMYYQMSGSRFKYDVNARLVITVQESIKRKDLETIDLLLPSIQVQNEFHLQVMPYIDKQIYNDTESLIRLRDTLLPKLISGELRIPEAQAQLEEALG